MQHGDVVCVKTTGEKVYLLAETDRRTWKVRRPVVRNEGIAEHVTDEFFEGELESIPDYADRKVNELIIQTRAQKKLMKLEAKLVEEVEGEIALEETAKEEPSVN